MKILVVDDEFICLETTKTVIKKVLPSAEIYTFLSPFEALLFAKQNHIDIVFLDIGMPEINGVKLAKHLRKHCSRINIIFLSESDQYMKEAFELFASGYVRKPLQEKDVTAQIENLRYPISKEKGKRIRAVTFGVFELLVDEKFVHFKRRKAKELLAFLIDRRSQFSRKELAAVLFESSVYGDRERGNLSQIIQALKEGLKEAVAEDILVHHNNAYSVNIEKFSCDLYEYLEGNRKEDGKFFGRYMENYSWGEETIGALMIKNREI